LIKEPHPYIRRLLLSHAVRGGCLDDETVPPSFLPWDDAGAARAHLGVPPPDGEETAHLAAWCALWSSSVDLDRTSRAAGIALHTLPRQHLGSKGTGWSSWVPAGQVLCRMDESIANIEVATAMDGTIFVSLWTDGRIETWNVTTGHRVGIVPQEAQPTPAFVLGGDGRGGMWSAVLHGDHSVVMFDVLTGRATGSVVEPELAAFTFCRYADGRFALALGLTSGLIRLLTDPRLSSEGAEALWHPGPIHGLAGGLVPGTEGLLVSNSPGTGTVVWDLAGGQPKVTLPLAEPGERAEILAVALSVAGHGQPRVAESRDDVVRLWDAGDGSLVGVWDFTDDDDDEKTVQDIAFAGETEAALLAVNLVSDRVALIDATDGGDFGELRTDRQMFRTVRGTVGRRPLLISAGEEHIRLWDATVAALTAQPDGDRKSPPVHMAFGLGAEGRRILATADLFTGSVLDAETGVAIGAGRSHCSALGTSNEGHLLFVTHKDGGAQLRDATVGLDIGDRVPCHNGFLDGFAVGMSPGGEHLLAVAELEGMGLWHPRTGKRLDITLPSGTDRARSVSVGAGNHLAADLGEVIRVFDLGANARMVLEIPGRASAEAVLTLGNSPDGWPFVAVTGHNDSRVEVWNIESGERVVTLETLGEVTALASGGALFGHVLAIAGTQGCLVLPWSRMPA
jgi:WD40 repeat protein